MLSFKQSGVALAIYPRGEAGGGCGDCTRGSGFAGITLAYSAQSEAEVDEIIRDLKSKGVEDYQRAAEGILGTEYSSYFS
ncbi:MAG: hypothetical protein MZU97_07590 [Bacillus subtilis]|nr:hypothetical protein [Bacillus subtilis]